jgi:phosphinothricin acetyltransferase
VDDTEIRAASEHDLGAINDIYNHYVAHSTATFQERPETPGERAAWFRDRGEAHPVLVAERDGEVVGWASLSPHRARSGYRHTCEVSIYLREDACGAGLGRRLLGELLERGRAAGHHVVLAGTCTEQEASMRLHRALGFEQVALFREVGRKFDRWLDVAYFAFRLE